MIYDIIIQLFGQEPNIPDMIIAIVSSMFGFILLPQLRDVIKGETILNLFTASLTAIGIGILTITFFYMQFWISFAADFFSTVVWSLLFIFSYRNIRKNKEKLG